MKGWYVASNGLVHSLVNHGNGQENDSARYSSVIYRYKHHYDIVCFRITTLEYPIQPIFPTSGYW